ncbi:MAG TPA: GAF domain-containing protein, partial [Longimicrobiaceae bacterium]|nr:GAF domain-containing protein [Longimicrobiaceae bacterium]
MSGAAALGELVQLHSLEPGELERFLQRQKAAASLGGDIDLGLQLRQILEKARELVPSESGSILLDDPLRKVDDRARNDLCFVAAFGPASEHLAGQQLSAAEGIVGQVYRTGQPHLSSDVSADRIFSREIDARTGHLTRSIVAAPIAIGSTVCGVIELVNRLEGTYFTDRDLVILEIFASYTSSTLQNALDAKRAHELARRDDLTGLYNDRWLHHRLVEVITGADASGEACSLIF